MLVRAIGGSSSGAEVKFTLIGSLASTSTGEQNIDCTDNISKYQYLLFTGGTELDSNGAFIPSTSGPPNDVNSLVSVDYFKNGTTMTYKVPTGGGTFNVNITYVNDTRIKTSRTSQTNRNFRVYGLK